MKATPVGELTVVIGTQLRSAVRVWDRASPYYVPGIRALMVSFAELAARAYHYDASAEAGLGTHLRFAGQVFLDNGSFTFITRGRRPPIDRYLNYVCKARPDWCPVPLDYIPSPSMSRRDMRQLARRTARVNTRYAPEGLVPVIHLGAAFDASLTHTLRKLKPPRIAIGGIVPYLRSTNAAHIRTVVDSLASARKRFRGAIHVFGLGGGISSLHLAAALGVESADSSSWRVCAARGIVLVPGKGQMNAIRLRSARRASADFHFATTLRDCGCVICSSGSIDALCESGGSGFAKRASHNLWVLLHEAALINRRLATGNLRGWSSTRLAGHRFAEAVERAHVLLDH